MGGCAVPFCNNSSAKGYIMKVFPRDPQRRAQWAKNVNRKNWNPTNSSYICEVHFERGMWESKRCDDKRKLKLNAVPTMFVNGDDSLRDSQVSSIHSEIDGQSLETCVFKIEIDTKSCGLSIDNSTQVINGIQDEEYQVIKNKNSGINTSPGCSSCDILNEHLNNKDIKIKKLEGIINKMQFNQIHVQKANRIMKYKLSTLEDKINKNKYRTALYQVFTPDQVKALFTKSQRARSWSEETIHRALKLKFACGTNGYEEMNRQGIPLPGLRTLRRKLENYKFGEKI